VKSGAAKFSDFGKPVRLLLLIFLPAFGMYFLWTVLNSKTYPIASVSTLQDEFLRAHHPLNAHRVSDIRVSSKFTTQAVYSDFSADIKPREIIDFYVHEYSSDGWRKKASEETADGRYIARLCKNDIDVVIETIETTREETRYYFGVDRHSGPREHTGCDSQ
jgi:hypothetical protein